MARSRAGPSARLGRQPTRWASDQILRTTDAGAAVLAESPRSCSSKPRAPAFWITRSSSRGHRRPDRGTCPLLWAPRRRAVPAFDDRPRRGRPVGHIAKRPRTIARLGRGARSPSSAGDSRLAVVGVPRSIATRRRSSRAPPETYDLGVVVPGTATSQAASGAVHGVALQAGGSARVEIDLAQTAARSSASIRTRRARRVPDRRAVRNDRRSRAVAGDRPSAGIGVQGDRRR